MVCYRKQRLSNNCGLHQGIVNGRKGVLRRQVECKLPIYETIEEGIDMNEQKTTGNNLLWHYTTPEGLTGIIKSSFLWATDVFYLNDSSEFMNGIDIARKIIKQKISSLDKDKKKHLDRLNRFDTDLSFIGPDHNRPVYVCSLSKAENELSQWRAYCRGGGFSIGFPRQSLEGAIKGQHFEFKECIYNAKKQQKIIKDIIDSQVMPYIENPEQFKKKNPWSDISTIVLVGSNKFLWELYSTCPTLKHASFKIEKEWRLVSDHRHAFEKDENGKNKIRPELRTKNGLIIPYICIKLPKNKKFWRQVRIIIGPTKYEKELKGSVHTLFRKYHATGISIKYCEIPYREL